MTHTTFKDFDTCQKRPKFKFSVLLTSYSKELKKNLTANLALPPCFLQGGQFKSKA